MWNKNVWKKVLIQMVLQTLAIHMLRGDTRGTSVILHTEQLQRD